MENPQIVAMRKIGMSEEEIADVLEADKRIDKGEKLFELNADQKQAEKKMRQANRAPTVYNFTQRERKQDSEKRILIEALKTALAEVAEAVNVTNPEREIDLVLNGRKFKVTLSAPRK